MTTSTATLPQADRVETSLLSVADRCDSCGSQAYVRVEFPVGELSLCGHHFNKSEQRLRDLAVTVVDERYKLEPPSRKLDENASSVF